MGQIKIFVTRPLPEQALAVLRDHGDLSYNPEPDLSRDDLLTRAKGAAALVTILDDRVDEPVLAALPGLKVVSNVAVGFDNIDVGAATARRVIVTNTPGVLDDTTADFTFALILATARRVVEADGFLRSGQWTRWELLSMAGMDIHSKTLGIVGLGRIGRGVARRAKGFAMRLVYMDVARAPESVEQELGVHHVSKEILLRESDFVTLHVPLGPATRHYISDGEFAQMKSSAILINASRGPVVDQEALIRALDGQRIWGAGLDVFEGEPKVPVELVHRKNVVLTPHMASSSIATRTRMAVIAAENVVAVLRRERPNHVVNPAVFEG